MASQSEESAEGGGRARGSTAPGTWRQEGKGHPDRGAASQAWTTGLGRAGATRPHRSGLPPRRGSACRSSDTTFFFKNFFIEALSLPSMRAVADCTASAVSSNFLKAFSFTLRGGGVESVSESGARAEVAPRGHPLTRPGSKERVACASTRRRARTG